MELKNETLTLTIDETNMEPTSLQLNGVEFLYQKTATWKKDFPTLFPICGMLIDDQYTYENKNYHLTRHGFFRNIQDWKLIEQTATKAVFKFSSLKKFVDVYPWEFEILYQFEILNDQLKISTTVTNLSQATMYYSLGYHPAFLTKPTGSINFDQEQMLYSDSAELKYLVKNPVNGITINQTKVSDLDFSGSQFFWTTKNQAQKVSYEDDTRQFEIDLSTYANKTFILWSESNEANYVCFEPMDGHADFVERNNQEISQKDQIRALLPNKSQKHVFNLKLKLK